MPLPFSEVYREERRTRLRWGEERMQISHTAAGAHLEDAIRFCSGPGSGRSRSLILRSLWQSLVQTCRGTARVVNGLSKAEVQKKLNSWQKRQRSGDSAQVVQVKFLHSLVLAGAAEGSPEPGVRRSGYSYYVLMCSPSPPEAEGWTLLQYPPPPPPPKRAS